MGRGAVFLPAYKFKHNALFARVESKTIILLYGQNVSTSVKGKLCLWKC